MPFSSTQGKAWIERLVTRLIHHCKENSILDVGAGAGTYSELLRSKLPGTHFTAIEIWQPYHEMYKLQQKYDLVLSEDVRTFEPAKRYGITFCGDVLEHMTKEEALQVYEKLLTASEFVVISIPIVHYPQEAYLGNPYEIHVKDDWTHEEVMATFPHLGLTHREGIMGVYVGYNPQFQSKATLSKANQPLTAVYALYQNDQQGVRRFLQSVKEADQIVLCDIGATDQTTALIDEFAREHPAVHLQRYELCLSPWRFDDAKNIALSLVSPAMDLCICLQLDEYMEPGWKEQINAAWESGITGFAHRLKIIQPDATELEGWAQQIHLRKGHLWKLPVHEVLEYQDLAIIKELNQLTIFRQPYRDTTPENYEKLLEWSVKERPNNWKTWYHLAQVYARQRKWTEAQTAIDKAASLPEMNPAAIYRLKYEICRELQQTDQALAYLNLAILHLPARREWIFEKATYLFQLGRFREAFSAILEAEQHTAVKMDAFYNPEAWGDKFAQWKQQISENVKKEGFTL
ncbi:hypothetical protein [Brevibacillus fulvus]|uniref:Tetratricopeptide (TPR) repeat protein n=1 Tax=Brevibacillus fulvus TaxID=1125967 RepID=A0A938XW51_9BACL|nr:hypothetical protein [Brevibacillus fulvus]MBM7589031.1 tetratricopeptide (TPR) repeat protein [Brevibacillus fulvus]